MPAPSKKAPIRKRRTRREARTFGLSAPEVASGDAPAEVAEQGRAVEADGGRVLATYREPYGGRWLILCALPIEAVAATPYQRDLSEAHVGRLGVAIEKIGAFLDPVVVVRNPSGEGARYFTPNGHHRLAAMRKLGARSIVALFDPDPRLEYQILALNTEKAHNLRERAAEVLRMARGLAALAPATEADFAFQFEQPSLIVLGGCYERRPRFSGSAYHPILKRTCAEFWDRPLKDALAARAEQADEVLALDDVVTGLVDALKARGLESPYLRVFVVARLNPLRFARGATADFDATIEKMRAASEKLDPAKIRREDLARAPPVPDSGE